VATAITGKIAGRGMFFRSILIAVAVDHHSAVRLPVALLDDGSVSGLIA
jgi:hypothetical protein